MTRPADPSTRPRRQEQIERYSILSNAFSEKDLRTRVSKFLDSTYGIKNSRKPHIGPVPQGEDSNSKGASRSKTNKNKRVEDIHINRRR